MPTQKLLRPARGPAMKRGAGPRDLEPMGKGSLVHQHRGTLAHRTVFLSKPDYPQGRQHRYSALYGNWVDANVPAKPAQ